MREYKPFRRTNGDRLSRLSIAIILLHVIVTAAHSVAHMSLNILMNSWQNAYIFVVIVLLPLVCGYLIWRRARFGYLILFLSMLAALAFGGYYHFVLAGTDNVSTVAHHPAHSWAQLFQVSAVLIAMVELAGAVVGVVGVRDGK